MTTWPPVSSRAVRGHREGTVFQRKADGLWVAAVSLPNGKRRRRYARTKALAQEALRDLQRELGRGVRRTRRLTVAALLRSWFADVLASDRAPKTVAGYRSLLDVHLLPELGHYQVEDLTAGAIDGWLARSGGEPQTLRHRRAALRAAFNWGIAQRLVSDNPVMGSKAPRLDPTPPTILTLAQAQQVIEQTRGDWLHPLWVLFLTTGMREAEALALTWEDDIDLDVGTVTVRSTLHHTKDPETPWERRATKTRRVRTVPLTQLAVDALREHRTRMYGLRQPDWTYYRHAFLNERGLPYHGTRVLLLWKRRLAELGLPPVVIHECRHTAASLMLSLGYGLEDVKQILGHSTIRVTSDVYSHPVDRRLRLVAEGLDRALREKSGAELVQPAGAEPRQ